jgi:nucleolar pre-ribosomal-associated protein 1
MSPQLRKLYERDAADEGDAQGNIPADLVHHFLLAISTHPGTGICFRDNGWYPREENPELGGSGMRQGRIYNKILANFLKSLKVNEDLRQQELAIKIIAACPELVTG